MANGLYDKGREGFLGGDIDWDGNKIRAILVDTGAYTVDKVNHQFLSDIPAIARIATSPPLTGKTIAAGVADADDTVVALVTGTSVEAVAIVKAAVNDAAADDAASAQRLIAWLDTGLGLPFSPNGGDVNIKWPNDATRIFKL